MGQAASQNDEAEPDQEDDEIIPMRSVTVSRFAKFTSSSTYTTYI